MEITISASSFSSDETFVAKSLPPTISAPAFSASVKASPPAKTAILTSLPVPFGSDTVVLIFCSGSFVSKFKEKTTSMDSSNFALAVSLQIFKALEISCFSSGIWFFYCFISFTLFFHVSPFGTVDFCLPKY